MPGVIVWVEPGSCQSVYMCRVETEDGLRELLFTFTEESRSIVQVIRRAKEHNLFPEGAQILASDDLSELLWGTDSYYVESSGGERLTEPHPDFVGVLIYARKSPRVGIGARVRRESDGVTMAHRAPFRHLHVRE